MKIKVIKTKKGLIIIEDNPVSRNSEGKLYYHKNNPDKHYKIIATKGFQYDKSVPMIVEIGLSQFVNHMAVLTKDEAKDVMQHYNLYQNAFKQGFIAAQGRYAQKPKTTQAIELEITQILQTYKPTETPVGLIIYV